MDYDPHKRYREAGTRAKFKSGADIGSADRIRASLKRGPLLMEEIMRAAHISQPKCKSLVNALMNVTGGVVVLQETTTRGEGKRKRYALYDDPAARAQRGEAKAAPNIALPARLCAIERGELRRDPFEFMKLAMSINR